MTRVILIFFTIVGVVGVGVTLPLYLKYDTKVLYYLLAFFVILAYEFLMRIIFGIILIIPKYNVNSWVFKVGKKELGLYKKMNYKSLVQKIPTFNPKQYDSQTLSIEEIIQNTCRNELTHKVYFVLTFAPIIWSVWFGSLALAIVQACIVCLNDVFFISIQRFSRDRLLSIQKRLSRKANDVQ